jgi:hypothetical protein
MSIIYTSNPTLLNAVTTTTTSQAFDISKRQQITFEFLCASHTSGNGVFTVDVSNDGVNWITSVALQDAQSTASGTWVASQTLSANGTKGAYLQTGWRFCRVVCTVTTDGAYSAFMHDGG